MNIEPKEDKRDPEMCVHALSVDEDMRLLCCAGKKPVDCNGPCDKFVDAFGEERKESNSMTIDSVTVRKSGGVVFQAYAGRLGNQQSAKCDFLCFASEAIGAPYTYVEDAKSRLQSMGFEVEIVNQA